MQPHPFSLVYAPLVREHLAAIERKYHALIRAAIEEQLRFEPNVETRNRKPLRRSIVSEADWEIRFGPSNRFRILYSVDLVHHEVYVLAVGTKRESRLSIAGEEVNL